MCQKKDKKLVPINFLAVLVFLISNYIFYHYFDLGMNGLLSYIFARLLKDITILTGSIYYVYIYTDKRAYQWPKSWQVISDEFLINFKECMVTCFVNYTEWMSPEISTILITRTNDLDFIGVWVVFINLIFYTTYFAYS